MNRDRFLIKLGSAVSMVILAASSATSQPNSPPRDPAMAQVTSVSELRDVQPTDWAFQALQSLVERYGILVGYPDRTFRGNQPLSRYEFAGALNTFLQRVNQLIESQQSDRGFRREDLATLAQLQAQYQPILNDLNSRMNRLEATTTELEANQFSTTTRLTGQAILSATTETRTNTTIVARARINLLTSLTGADQLVTQLETGNNGLDAIGLTSEIRRNLVGTLGSLADSGGLEYIGYGPSVNLSQLHYTFRPTSDLAVTVGPQMAPRDWIDRNRFANNSAIDFSSSFFVNNPLIVQNAIDRPGGAGAAVSWRIGGSPLIIRALYIAANGNTPTAGAGLFSGNQYQGSAELEYSLNQNLAVRLQYTNAGVNQTTINAGGINLEWAVTRKLGVFGRYGFGTYQGFNTALAQRIDFSPQTWMAGIAFRDLVIPGSTAGFAIGQPFITSRFGDATQTNYEVFYNLPLNDSVSITPALLVVDSPTNRAVGSIWEGVLRTVILF